MFIYIARKMHVCYTYLQQAAALLASAALSVAVPNLFVAADGEASVVLEHPAHLSSAVDPRRIWA